MKTSFFFLCLCFALLLSWGAAPANATCRRDAECDDGLFCNGEEVCRRYNPQADDRRCAPGTPPCTTPPNTVCNEAEARCDEPPCIDRDGDGHEDIACGGDDCDDYDPDRYPGNRETCDPKGRDEDCDPSTPGTRDADGDGYVDIACRNYRHPGRGDPRRDVTR
jgi:hypothetical protein